MIGYFIIIGLVSLLGMVMSGRLKSTFQKYSQYGLSSNMSGREVAQHMLNHYGIHDVKIVPARGALTDHYNPKTKTIALSEPVFNSRSISAAAVAAHECGHAVQDATDYPMLNFRSNLVPLVQISSTVQRYLIMLVVFSVGAGMNGSLMLLIFTITFGITCLFALVTLPVEFDASKRALAYLDNTGITHGAEYDGARKALWWAAMTYVVSAVGSIAMFLFFLLRFMGSRN
jgi:Zn-dependent membrane protease YugP